MANALELYGENLNDRQSAYVENVLSGMSSKEAALTAGYSDNPNTPSQLKSSPAIQRAIAAGLRKRIADDAPIAYKVIIDMVTNDKAPPSTRLTAAKYILDKSGLFNGNPLVINPAQDNSLSGLTPEKIASMDNDTLAQALSRISFDDLSPAQQNAIPDEVIKKVMTLVQQSQNTHNP